ncbi:hypothetical protein BT67DRAFT_153595 [Trichocladium antarcticum]|uniref:Uncharacterized protein n=1 Tax=Trichocladium antarcticum TaxID=1450529 RepID=A0AAN6UEM9_9PEZI|nr:hypothetical protein BT67DRAFT_153595 [Trichocladium antarcticum]
MPWLEAGACVRGGVGGVVRATSTLLPVPLPVPTVAVVVVPASSAASSFVSWSSPLPVSFCATAVLVRDSFDGLLWPGFKDCGVGAWLRAAAAGGQLRVVGFNDPKLLRRIRRPRVPDAQQPQVHRRKYSAKQSAKHGIGVVRGSLLLAEFAARIGSLTDLGHPLSLGSWVATATTSCRESLGTRAVGWCLSRFRRHSGQSRAGAQAQAPQPLSRTRSPSSCRYVFRHVRPGPPIKVVPPRPRVLRSRG